MIDQTNSANPDDFRECPFCAELIKKAAIKCKHCGSMFSQSATSQQQVPLPPTAEHKGVEQSSRASQSSVLGNKKQGLRSAWLLSICIAAALAGCTAAYFFFVQKQSSNPNRDMVQRLPILTSSTPTAVQSIANENGENIPLGTSLAVVKQKVALLQVGATSGSHELVLIKQKVNGGAVEFDFSDNKLTNRWNLTSDKHFLRKSINTYGNPYTYGIHYYWNITKDGKPLTFSVVDIVPELKDKWGYCYAYNFAAR